MKNTNKHKSRIIELLIPVQRIVVLMLLILLTSCSLHPRRISTEIYQFKNRNTDKVREMYERQWQMRPPSYARNVYRALGEEIDFFIDPEHSRPFAAFDQRSQDQLIADASFRNGGYVHFHKECETFLFHGVKDSDLHLNSFAPGVIVAMINPREQKSAWNLILSLKVPFYNHLTYKDRAFYGVVSLHCDPFSEPVIVRKLRSSGAFRLVGYIYPEGGPSGVIKVPKSNFVSQSEAPDEFFESLLIEEFGSSSVTKVSANTYQFEFSIIGSGEMLVSKNPRSIDRVDLRFLFLPGEQILDESGRKIDTFHFVVEIIDGYSRPGNSTESLPEFVGNKGQYPSDSRELSAFLTRIEDLLIDKLGAKRFTE